MSLGFSLSVFLCIFSWLLWAWDQYQCSQWYGKTSVQNDSRH